MSIFRQFKAQSPPEMADQVGIVLFEGHKIAIIRYPWAVPSVLVGGRSTEFVAEEESATAAAGVTSGIFSS